MNVSSHSASHLTSSLLALPLRQDAAVGLGSNQREGIASGISGIKGTDQDNDFLSSNTSPSTLKTADTATSPVYEDPRLQAKEKQLAEQEKKQQQAIDQEVSQLAARDREVRAHEQAHMSAGGQYAGSATYEYTRGPNGVSYATGGEVSISTGSAGTPEETLRKAQVIRSAALAPAEPSSQDRKVAALASQMEVKARSEIAEVKKQEAAQTESDTSEEVNDKSLDKDLSKGVSDPESEEKAKAKADDHRMRSHINKIFSSATTPGILLSDHA